MAKSELIRRYIVFMLGITIGALGVTLTTRATLGINSVACASYVVSVYFPITMGTFTIMFNGLMLILQFFMLSKGARRFQFINILMQVPALFVFGLLLDFFMFLTRSFHPEEMG